MPTPDDPLTDAERDALDDLIPPDRQTEHLVDDLVAAVREAQHRRIRNTANGAAVIAALHRELRSWRELEVLTGVPFASARRWSKTPPSVPRPDEARDDPSSP